MSRILSVWVDDKPGVLSRIAGLVARRGFNIESLSVSNTEEAARSRVTMVVDADEVIVEQVTKQLNKLINVVKVVDLTDTDHIDRELVLYKVNAKPNQIAEIEKLLEVFRTNIIEIKTTSITIEAVGSPDKLKALQEVLQPYGIKEIVRSGIVAMSRESSN